MTMDFRIKRQGAIIRSQGFIDERLRPDAEPARLMMPAAPADMIKIANAPQTSLITASGRHRP